MRWVSFRSADSEQLRAGVLVGDRVHAAPAGVTLLDCFSDSPEAFAELGEQLTAAAAEVFALADVALAAPVPRPPAVRDFLVFDEHAENSYAASGIERDRTWWDNPVFYFTNPAAVRGPGDRIPIAPGSERFDYEAELGAVIGWPSADVAPADAGALIAGHCLFIDWSSRDLQRAETRHFLGPAKGKDTATSLGPVLVTPDELAPYRVGCGYSLDVHVTVNGRLYTASSYSKMYWSFEEMISYAARGTRLVPGDVIGSGTCGQGCILELQYLHGPETYPWLQPGDVVRLEADVLGHLEHVIVSGPAPIPLR